MKKVGTIINSVLYLPFDLQVLKANIHGVHVFPWFVVICARVFIIFLHLRKSMSNF